MNEKENRQFSNVDSWMFRVPGEKLVLFLTLFVLSVFGFFVYNFNFYVFFLILVGGIILVHLQQSQYLGSAVRVHENQFPEIFDVFKIFSTKLRINRASLYITQDPYLQAFTLGYFRCTVVMTSALVEQLNRNELNFVMAHELAHFKAGHTKVSTLLFPIGHNNFITNTIFGFWNRKAEYSCDRCGLILTKDVESALSALIKLAIGKNLFQSLDVRGYIAQIRSAGTKSVRFSELLTDHPFITNRIVHLIDFWKENFVVK
jgi:Zn-dependent protease with chaperone function